MTHTYRPRDMVEYTGTLHIDGRQAGDVLLLIGIEHAYTDDKYWRAVILRTGQETCVFDSFIQPLGDQDNGNP